MIHTLKHIAIHSLKDNISLLPFLFVTYCIMEYLEHFMTQKAEGTVRYSGKLGPLWGGLLGIVPQCGFSAAAASLFSGGVITMGTMLAIFLSTSDEMLPIFISAAVPVATIGKILVTKAFFAVLGGFIVDFVLRHIGKKYVTQKNIHDLCEQEHCHCHEKHSVWKSALLHTVKVFGFVFAVSAVINLMMEYGGDTVLTPFAANNSLLAIILTGLVGLVPNCAASVIITQLYLKEIISAGAMMSGLLVSAGVGVLVLFRTNRPMKQNAAVVILLYTIGIAAGFGLDLFRITF
jgi:hypothetical protein